MTSSTLYNPITQYINDRHKLARVYVGEDKGNKLEGKYKQIRLCISVYSLQNVYGKRPMTSNFAARLKFSLDE